MHRLVIGAAAAAVIALLARRAGALTRSGAIAAVASGALAASAGWSWAILLVAYFVATTALSRLGAAGKAARTGSVVAKGGARDWRQVAANGGVFAIASALHAVQPASAWAALGAGSLAAAAADSWATEIGTLASRPPRSIRTFRPVAPGTSGGVTLAGTAAMVAGASFIALLGALLGSGNAVALAAIAGGIAGALVDSIIGAQLQARRWCPACEQPTEQRTHRCGATTRPAGGIAWVDNDVVNAACALTGGLLAMVLAG